MQGRGNIRKEGFAIFDLKRWLRSASDLIYPRRCPLCGDIADGFCSACQERMHLIKSPYCFRCGKQLEDERAEYCTDCISHEHLYVRGRALFPYEKREKEAIYKIKYDNKREYLITIADFMADCLWDEIRGWNIDVCVPIPMHKKKKRKRGYNQAEILADLLSERWDLEMDPGLLVKLRETAQQKELSAGERRKNLKGAFAAKDCSHLNILLVDDVYTTGSTIDAAAEQLLQAGASKVYFVTVCIGNGN